MSDGKRRIKLLLQIAIVITLGLLVMLETMQRQEKVSRVISSKNDESTVGLISNTVY